MRLVFETHLRQQLVGYMTIMVSVEIQKERNKFNIILSLLCRNRVQTLTFKNLEVASMILEKGGI